MSDTAWARLERYARFRGHMSLQQLPCDVLRHVVRFLERREVLHLAEAIVGRSFVWKDTRFAPSVPTWLRDAWAVCFAVERVHALISSATDDGLWFASAFSRSCVHVNWSPFSSGPESPVATFLWGPETPHLVVRLHNVEIERCVRRAIRLRSACVTGSLYIPSAVTTPATCIRSFSFAVLPPNLPASNCNMAAYRGCGHGGSRFAATCAKVAWRASAHELQLAGF